VLDVCLDTRVLELAPNQALCVKDRVHRVHCHLRNQPLRRNTHVHAVQVTEPSDSISILQTRQTCTAPGSLRHHRSTCAQHACEREPRCRQTPAAGEASAQKKAAAADVDAGGAVLCAPLGVRERHVRRRGAVAHVVGNDLNTVIEPHADTPAACEAQPLGGQEHHGTFQR